MYTVYALEDKVKREIEGLLSTQDLFSTNDVLCIRLPLAYKIIYKKFVRESKYRMDLLKKSIGAAIVATARFTDAELHKISETSQVVVNLNIHHVEQKVEQKLSVDNHFLQRARKALENIMQILETMEKQQVIYRYAILNYVKKLRQELVALEKLFDSIDG